MTEIDPALIDASLEAVAAACDDPTPRVYEALFARHPEMQALFVLDHSGAVRGQMLAQAIASLVDLAGPQTWGGHLMRAEIVNHEGWGVPPNVFAVFYPVVRDAFRDLAGAAWTAEMDAAWDSLLARVDVTIARAAA
ncbi:MAG: globin [Caulobacteraceae bacterium]|nr:globin [Caulobacteraceae bacterium]